MFSAMDNVEDPVEEPLFQYQAQTKDTGKLGELFPTQRMAVQAPPPPPPLNKKRVWGVFFRRTSKGTSRNGPQVPFSLQMFSLCSRIGFKAAFEQRGGG